MTDWTPYTDAAGDVVFIQTDVNGKITQITRAHVGNADITLLLHPDARPILPSEAAVLDAWPYWTVEHGFLEKVAAPEDDLATYKDKAKTAVDEAAETARLAWLTPGAGQTIEYQQTANNAVAVVAANVEPTAGQYPWLDAEQAALAAAGTIVTKLETAKTIKGLYDAWVSAGAQIKETRRLAKLRVDVANTKGEVDAIQAGLTWPVPT